MVVRCDFQVRKLILPITMFTKNFLSNSNLADDPVYELLESLPEEALLIDPNGLILSANTLLASRFGLSAEECIGANVYDLILAVLQLPELAVHYREKIAEVLCTGKRMVFEDGKEELIWKITINPVLSPEKTLSRLFITIADISGQNRMTARLDESKQKFNDALQATHAGIWEWNLVTDEVVWSDDIWTLCGLVKSHKKPSIHLWASLMHPDDRKSAVTAVIEAAKNETELTVEYRVCYPDGSMHWMMCIGKLLRDFNSSKARYIGTIIDITERKKFQERLVAANERMHFILAATRAGIWEYDLSSNTYIWSDEMWRLSGLKPQNCELTYENWINTIIPEDRERVRQTTSDAVKNSSKKGRDVETGKDSKKHSVEFTGISKKGKKYSRVA